MPLELNQAIDIKLYLKILQKCKKKKHITNENTLKNTQRYKALYTEICLSKNDYFYSEKYILFVNILWQNSLNPQYSLSTLLCFARLAL